MLERLFGKGRRAALARKAEAAGELAKAAALFVEADQPAEAARVMLLRGDGESDPAKRLVHFTQAAATAPPDHETAKAAKKKRALLVLALAGDGAVSAATRHDVVEAARDLEAIGDAEGAAAAYARVGDVEGQARALTAAGEVDELEHLLTMQQDKDRTERDRAAAHREVELLATSGRRREAIAAAEACAKQTNEAGAREALTTRAEQLRARRVGAPTVKLSLRGRALTLVLGAKVVVGRSEGALQIASAAVSRQHLSIERDGAEIVVRDLGSRNGTQLRGLALAGATKVGDGVELRLGGEVKVTIAPADEIAGAVAIELGGKRYVAPLGGASLGVGAWRLEAASDGWVELVTDGAPAAYAGDVALAERATLLVGDALASARGGEAVLRVLG